MLVCYSKSGKPISLAIWARLMEDPTYRIVRQTYTKNNRYWVSTVWLGTDHDSSSTPHKPVIFESMVFARKGGKLEDSDRIQLRYTNMSAAIKGHNILLEEYNKKR